MQTLAGISATKTLEAVRKWTNQNPVFAGLDNKSIRERGEERGGLGLHSASTHYYYYKLLMI